MKNNTNNHYNYHDNNNNYNNAKIINDVNANMINITIL